jgi:hypothetical protein
MFWLLLTHVYVLETHLSLLYGARQATPMGVIITFVYHEYASHKFLVRPIGGLLKIRKCIAVVSKLRAKVTLNCKWKS